MKYRIFELFPTSSGAFLDSQKIISESKEMWLGKKSLDPRLHIEKAVRADFWSGRARGAISDSGLAFAINGDGKEIDRCMSVYIGLFPPDVALMNTTIYAEPNFGKLCLIPYPMKSGQTPKHINVEDRSDWETIAYFHHDRSDFSYGVLNMKTLLAPVKEKALRLSPGEFMQINLSSFGLSEELQEEMIDPAYYKIYRKDTKEHKESAQ